MTYALNALKRTIRETMINYERLYNELVKVYEKTDEGDPMNYTLMDLMDIAKERYTKNLFETASRLANTDEK